MQSEKELEDYICNHIDMFIDFLKEIYKKEDINIDNIEFVGRQVVVGDSRFDLLFEVQEKTEDIYFKIQKTFIVVELKNRIAEPKDVAQLSRYLNLLRSLSCDERVGSTLVDAKGILLTNGLNSEVQDIQMYLNDYTNADIKFVHTNISVNFEQDHYYYKDNFLDSMVVDSRLKKINQEVLECGKKEND